MTQKDNQKDPLADIRKRIDEIDKSIQSLVSERATCAAEVAKVKQKQGETGHFYRPEREAQVLRAVMERNNGPLTNESIAGVFREIMAACLAHERPLKVAFLGPEGTYTHSAAAKHFGSFIEPQPVDSIEEVFRIVEAGGANFGAVPVENSSAGVINHTLDLFMKSPLTISGEVALRIRHNLLTELDSLEKIDRVYAHQQSLSQCNAWLNKNLPNVERIAMNSNAQAVVEAKEKGAASIGGALAAEIYEVPILAADIEDEPDNTTRFAIIGQHVAPPSGDDRTSLLVFVQNKPGSLFDLLKPLADRNISMSNIESRPSRRGVWDYVFFIDIDGHRDEVIVKEAIAEIEKASAMVTILGSYPKAVL
ncbi:Chorismate mutase I / Prephenate dehydratase [hydrothermal vent metagenome]|uniref:Bifunctional chorismate mutase/prephenate dehydratase n=1 Tax=hydrothermal vent metagenome TaxID=652676 RepID=A0A3B0WE97_9ZZZZ